MALAISACGLLAPLVLAVAADRIWVRGAPQVRTQRIVVRAKGTMAAVELGGWLG